MLLPSKLSQRYGAWSRVSYFVAIVIAAFGSSGLYTLIDHIIDRRSGRKKELEEIKGTLNEILKNDEESKQDITRLQLLNLIQHSPSREVEILTVAKRYFDDLEGNWYMESIFTEWAGKQDVPLPAWFKE